MVIFIINMTYLQPLSTLYNTILIINRFDSIAQDQFGNQFGFQIFQVYYYEPYLQYISLLQLLLMKQDQKNQKYYSIHQLINLPKKRPLNPDQVLFPKNEPTEKELPLVDIFSQRNALISNAQSRLQMYSDIVYKFVFPASKFPPVAQGKRNNISYEQKVYVEDEDTFENRLTPKQIEQIKQNGQFEVQSKAYHSGVPYVWKINGCILRSRQGRAKIWNNGLAWCYNLLEEAASILKETVPKQLKKLALLPVKFFAIIFGKKQLRAFYVPNYRRELQKDFWNDIVSNELNDLRNQIGHQFLDQLYVEYEPALYIQVDPNLKSQERSQQIKIREQKISAYRKKKQKVQDFKQAIRSVEDNFSNDWLKIRKRVLTKISNEPDQLNEKLVGSSENDEQPLATELVKKQDNAILEKLYKQKFLIYTAHLKQNLPKQNLSKGALQGLMQLIMIFHVISTELRQHQTSLALIQSSIWQKIDKKYYIRSKNQKFRIRKFNQQFAPIKAQLQSQLYSSLLSNLKLLNLTPTYQKIYQKYVQFWKNYPTLLAQCQQKLTKYYQPSRTFRTTYILFPPYQVVKLGQKAYCLKRKQEMKIDTSTHFWKCALYCMRFKSWTLNCFKFLLGVCWAGPLGLRCLFGIQNFQYDEECQYTTGVKRDITRPPFLGVFGKVLRGIKKSRDRFEALPDRGLFGKSCTRLCNYIQCYIFRFFFVGVIGVLMLYPVGIILCSFLCLIGVFTCWIWVPLAMVLCYIFNILVFQFQISEYPSGCLIRSVPILSLIFKVLLSLAKIIGSILFLILIAPLISFLYFLYLIIQRAMRTISDVFMGCIIGCLGRTPSRDTAVAKKVSGPGMSRNHFYSIAEQDVYVLTQSALQQILVYKYIQLTRKQISQTKEKYTSITSILLKPFGHSNPNLPNSNDLINKNYSNLLNNFNYQASNFLARYPSNPRGVRFTQQQIQLYFQNCVKIVKNFVVKEKIQDWIFEEKGVLFEDYDELTRVIWMGIFNCGEEIFQPLEKIDSRFKLVDDQQNNSKEMKQNIHSIMMALEGEVELSQKKINFHPAKRSILQKDQPFDYISSICSLHNSNSQTSIFVDENNPNCLFVPPRNLQDVKQYDEHQKQKSIAARSKVIQM